MTGRRSLEQLFQALGDRTRLRILNLLAEGEIFVCFFVCVLDEGQPKVSRHLAYLRRAGLVNARRDGKWMHYRLADSDGVTEKVVAAALEAIQEDRQMKRDRMALRRVCCSVKRPEIVENAPLPSFV